MYAAALLLDLSEAPAPKFGLNPIYQVLVDNRRLPRALVASVEPVFDDHGSFTVKAPLKIALRGRVITNPVLDLIQPGSNVEVFCDGVERVANGWYDRCTVDLQTGWVTLICQDTTADLERTNHGVGVQLGWDIPPEDDEDEEDDEIPTITTVVSYNATGGIVDTPGGRGISSTYGPVKGPTPWHFRAWAFTVSGEAKLQPEMLLQIAAGASTKKVVTMTVRFLDQPKRIFKISVSTPGDVPAGRWTDWFALPTVYGEPGRTKLVNIALHSPMPGKGANMAALRMKREKAPDDPTVEPPIEVPVGGTSAGLCYELAREGFQRSRAVASVGLSGNGMVFSDGMKIDPGDLSTYMSLISKWSDTVEWRWIPGSGTMQFGGIGDCGVVRNDLVASTNPGARAKAVSLSGSSKGMATRTTVTGKVGKATYRFLTDGGGVRRSWDRVENAPDFVKVEDFAGFVALTSQNRGAPVEVVLTAPPGGRTPGDWLRTTPDRAALRVGDYVPSAIDAAAFSQETILRITRMRLEPTNNDRLTITLEPIP